MNVVLHSMAQNFGVTSEQLTDEWNSMDSDYPFREIVSLRKRSTLQHAILDEETCESVLQYVLLHAKIQLRPHLDHKSKKSLVSSTPVWDEWKPRAKWRKLFDDLLPKSFFEDVGRLYQTVSDACQLSDIVDSGEFFVPRRIQVNVYPAGKYCGLAEHWDRHAILGVTSILLTPISEEDFEDDLVLNEEYRSFPDEAGWECGGLRRGSGLCALVGTTHAVKTRIRTKPRVTMNVVF